MPFFVPHPDFSAARLITPFMRSMSYLIAPTGVCLALSSKSRRNFTGSFLDSIATSSRKACSAKARKLVIGARQGPVVIGDLCSIDSISKLSTAPEGKLSSRVQLPALIPTPRSLYPIILPDASNAASKR